MNKLIYAALASVLLALPARAEMAVPDSEYAVLQATMQTHIDRNLVDGALLQLDEKSGTIHQLYPANAHPMIMVAGNYYYLCSEFRDAGGKDVMVNFLAAKDGDHYVIFHTVFGENEELEKFLEKQPKLASN